MVTELEALTGIETRRIHVDKGYRGHNHAQKFRVWISGQVQHATAPIRREMRRRTAVEPVIGHMKAEHRMGRNYLKGRDGDRCNAVLAAAGYNISLLLRWLEWLLRALMRMLLTTTAPAQNANERSSSVLHGRLFIGLPMGIVGGLVVGLFISPSDTTAAVAGAPGGKLTLSAIALGFLAGYGSESFFTYIDTLFHQVFRVKSNQSVPA